VNISSLILRVFGWKSEGIVPSTRKFIVVSAPHTSMYDFVIGRLYYGTVGIKPAVMIKRELFFFPLGYILRWLGGVPVDRGRKSNIIDRMVSEFQSRDEFILTITPEGTRKRVTEWKKGFYQIALAANVPILPGYFDYKRKVIGIGELIYPSGDIKKDMKTIKLFFKDITPRHPERFSVGNIDG
jgi:1-acyl-sn-glycerol-3-phosphate acyltransferase